MKRNTLSLLIILLLLSSKISFAQEQNTYARAKTKFYLQLGASPVGIRDRTISSFAYNNVGTGIKFGIGQENNWVKYDFFLDGVFNTDLTTDMRKGFRYDELTPDTVNGISGSEVNFSYFSWGLNTLFCLNSQSESKLKYWLGLQMRSSSIDTEFLILNNANRSVENYLSFSPTIAAFYQLHQNHKIFYEADLSLVSRVRKDIEYNLKPTYSKETEFISLYNYSGWLGFNGFLSMSNTLGYSFQFSRMFSLQALYQLSYLRGTVPLESRLVIQNFNLGLTFTL